MKNKNCLSQTANLDMFGVGPSVDWETGLSDSGLE